MHKRTILVLLVAVLVFLLPQRSWAMNKRFFTINQISGLVTVVEKGVSKPALNGMRIGIESEVSTGNNATVKIVTDDGNSINLAPNTKVVLKELKSIKNGQGSVTVLKEWAGKIFLRTKKLIEKDSRFQIETPNAVAGVRGTIWEVDYNGKDTGVKVFHGAVKVNSSLVQRLQAIATGNPRETQTIEAKNLDLWAGRQLSTAVQETLSDLSERTKRAGKKPATLQEIQRELDELKDLQKLVEEVYQSLGLPAPPPLNVPTNVNEILFGSPSQNNVPSYNGLY